MSAGVTLAEVLRRSTSVPAASRPASAARRPVYALPASVFDPRPERDPQPDEPEPQPEKPSAERDARGRNEDEDGSANAMPAPPAQVEAPIPPAPRPDRAGVLTERQLYQLWLRLTVDHESPVIVEWRHMYLTAMELGLTRLGNGNYRQDQWRKAVQRLVREGLAPAFYWRTRGRPPRTLTTRQHLAAWAIAGYVRLLGRRRRTWSADTEPRSAPRPAPTSRLARGDRQDG